MRRHLVACAACAAVGSLLLAQAAFAQQRANSNAAVTDQQFVMQASAAGLAEVDLGRLAMERATNPQVKQFGRHMLTDHGKANQQLLMLAKKSQFPIAPRMDQTHQDALKKLASLSGAAFDRQFMDLMVKDHEAAISLFTAQANNGKDAALKNFAAQTLPTLKEHLRMAREIQKSLSATGR